MIGMVFSMCGALVVGFLSGALTRARTTVRRAFCPCGVTRVCPLGHDDAPRSGTRTGARVGATPNAGHHDGRGTSHDTSHGTSHETGRGTGAAAR